MLSLVLFLALTLVAWDTAAAQKLDLPDDPVAPPLDEKTYARQLVSVLEEEIAHFARQERGADDAQRPIIRASINVRIIAAELLQRGDENGFAGSASVFFGQRIVRGRAALDESLITVYRMLADPALAEQGGAALKHIARFNDLAIDHADRLRTVDRAALDVGLALIFAPLVEVVATTEGVRPTSHWPRAASGPRPDPGEELATGLTTVADLFASDDIPDIIHVEASAILDWLRRGAPFEELHGSIHDALRDLLTAADITQTLARTTVLAADDRAAYETRIAQALALYRVPSRRAEARRLLAMLTSTARVLARFEDAAQAGVPVRALVTTLVAVDQPHGTAPAHDMRPSHYILRDVARLMRTRHGLDRGSFAPAVRAAAGRRLRQTIDAEKALLDVLPQLAEPAVRTDPAFISHLRLHRDGVEDLALLLALPEWRSALETIDARIGRGVETQIKQRAIRLTDPSRREATHRTLRRLGRDIGRFVPMPYEDQLRTRTEAASQVTAGRARELVRRIDETRRVWADELTRGVFDGENAVSLDRLHRLTTAMAASEGIEALDVTTLTLDRWAAWEMPPELVARALTDVPGRLKLATAAALDEDVATFERQLFGLEREAPLARLVLKLSQAMEHDLDGLPVGAAGVVGAIVIAPPYDARLGSLRDDLIVLCRYALEADEGWYQVRADAAAALQTFVNQLAADVLARITP